MRRLGIKETDIIQIAVQKEILRSEESRYDHRLHGILLICNGFSCNEVADFFGHSPRIVQYWIQCFEESGFAGLEETPQPGRPSRVNETILQKSLSIYSNTLAISDTVRIYGMESFVAII